MARVDVVLHPVRLRILEALLDGRPSTTGQLRERLPDVPPASMYRHVGALAEAGVLEVLDERRVRGATERTYQIRWDHARLEDATPDDHRRAFTAFVGSIMAAFERYLATEPADPAADGVTYRQAVVWLTDEEMSGLSAELESAVVARRDNEPTSDRTRRLITLASLPAGS
jgi:DNA-binding transcriptional ArsR family regulator